MPRCQLFEIPHDKTEVSALAALFKPRYRRLDNKHYTRARTIWEQQGWAKVELSLRPADEALARRIIRAILDMNASFTNQPEIPIAAIAHVLDNASAA